jgi:hypothetical protein
MGLAARARYEKFFSPAAVLPLMLQTYKRVSGNGHRIANPGDQDHLHPWGDLKE